MVKQKFKIGNKVIHKSGSGPVMVVKNYEPVDSEDVTCEWFDKSNTPQEKSFHQDTIELYQDPIIISGPSVRSIKNNY